MKIFLTGATGFIGRRVVALLAESSGHQVHCLVRDPVRLPPQDNVHPVRGSLPDDLAESAAVLPGCDVVVHLAAQTGKAPAEEHHRVQVDGTDRLIRAATEAAVPRFLHVSTIAVKYPEKKHYPYARSKEAAELVVRGSALDWAILRPTIVLGPGSPVADGLASLASAPVLPLFGGGTARMQPVHADDVALGIQALVDGGPLGGRTIDFGGRDPVTFAEFLKRLRQELSGRSGPALPVPVSPLIATLAVMERGLFRVLPVTAGQFYAFRHDGLAAEDPLAEPVLAARQGVPELIAGMKAEASRPPSTEERWAHLDRECEVLSQYLIGGLPGEEIRAHYRRAHASVAHPAADPRADSDSLVAFSRRGPLAARLADVYATLFDRAGPLRRKLVLLLAMFESRADTNERVDGPTVSSLPMFLVQAVLRGLLFLGLLPVAVLLLAPGRIASRRAGGNAATESAGDGPAPGSSP